jgi:hypothetical protein
MPKPIVVLMDGLGCDSSTIGHQWATNPSSRLLPTGESFELDQLINLTSQTGNEWHHTAYLNETYKYPVYRGHKIRTVQITRASASTRDGYIVLDDTRSPNRCFIRGLHSGTDHPLPALDRRILDFIALPDLLQRFPNITIQGQADLGYTLGEDLLESGTVPQFSEAQRKCSPKFKHVVQDQWVADTARLTQGYSLGEDLLESGVVPQYVQGRRKCSHKSKARPCDQWVEALVDEVDPDDKPLIYVAIGFTKGEERRRNRGEMAESDSPTDKLPYRRINFFPLMDQFGYERQDTEAYAHQVIARGVEPWWRSACVECPFSGIAGPEEEVLMKHRQSPIESGFALFVEHVSRRLNPKQTLYPSGRSLYQMLQDDSNFAALANLQERLESIPWAVYRVQRIVGTPVPWRRTEILAVSNYAGIGQTLAAISDSFSVPLTQEPDGFTRAWVEQRQVGAVRVEELLTIAPAVVREKHRPGWDKTWSFYHSSHEQLSLPFVK